MKIKFTKNLIKKKVVILATHVLSPICTKKKKLKKKRKIIMRTMSNTKNTFFARAHEREAGLDQAQTRFPLLPFFLLALASW